MKYKIFHIINCASRDIPDHFRSIGIRYLEFDWSDEENEIILDEKDKNLSEIELFISTARQKPENVLITSVNGKCRSCTVAIAYLMKKYQALLLIFNDLTENARYKLTLFEAIQFLGNKKPDLQLRKSFLDQLAQLERRLFPLERSLRPVKWIGADSLLSSKA